MNATPSPDFPEPLLCARDCVLSDVHRTGVGTFDVHAERLACVGLGQVIVSALGNPDLIEQGTLSLLGRHPAELLRSGDAVYVPLRLPLPETTKVRDAIILSARLLGLARADADQALSRCRMTAHANKKLGQLTRLQSRLVSLSHGLLGNPSVLILENLYVDLDDAELEIADAILDLELEGRKFIAGLDLSMPGSRSLMLRCDQVLLGAGSQVLPPQKPTQVPADGYWVTCSREATSLAELLESTGARVTKSPRDAVLFIRGASGQAIFQAARKSATDILELSPHSLEHDAAR